MYFFGCFRELWSENGKSLTFHYIPVTVRGFLLPQSSVLNYRKHPTATFRATGAGARP
jgi:hypothetical protein